MSAIVVEPVVVNPDVVSKKASINEWIDPLRRKGRVPAQHRIIHDRETARKPSRVFIFFTEAFRPIVKKITEKEIVINADNRKG